MTHHPAIVLVHGAWHGAWVWDEVARLLRRQGFEVLAVDLPGRGRSTGDDTLYGHAEFLRNEIARLAKPCLVVAHSYGGAVFSQMDAAGLQINAVIFLAAFQLEFGESCMRMNGSEAGSSSGDDSFLWDGEYMTLSSENAEAAFLNDVEASLVGPALGRIGFEHKDTVFASLTNASWLGLRSSYVVCSKDNAIIPAVQERMAVRSSRRFQLESGHSPMLSHPAAVAAIVEAESYSLD